ncbi:MAG: hypothetical protein QF692_04510 [Alphaproteobacteria bacterium]|jgi:predicted small lipoprotein YifL|nr:hypothetical protein [Alphaproteobacteria bacterium]MDP7222511.1 hypothetical protein [Alphaproteobacteria bacterium]
MKRIIYLSFAMTCILGIAACGIKPQDLDPPAGAEDTTFPQTYPQE